MISKIINTTILILLAVTTVGVLAFAFLYLWPVKVADYNTPYKVHPKTVEAGDTIFYTADFCKYLNIPAAVTRSLVDGVVISLPESKINLDTGCKKTDIPVVIPLNSPPGVYHIDLTLVYKINFLKDVTYKLKTNEFTVTNPCLTKDQQCR